MIDVHNTIYCVSTWEFGLVYCRIHTFTSSLTVSVSVFTLLALTLERYKVGTCTQQILFCLLR